jgi:hypothetical protein
LLDTHALLWFSQGDAQLSLRVRSPNSWWNTDSKNIYSLPIAKGYMLETLHPS